MAKFTKLFEPGKIGKMGIKNRTIFPPMVPLYADKDGLVTQIQIDYYAERAKGGCGLIIIESGYPRAGGYPGRISLDNDRVIPNLRQLVDAVHAAGAKIVLQVNPHRGRSDEVDPASPSENMHPLTGAKARALGIEEFKKYERQFGEGAARVKEAGFDGIEIHGGSGYLVSETLSVLANRRTDEYGGSVEKRATFALNLIKEAKKATGNDFPLIFRITADEKVEGGFGVKDAIIVCKLLEKAGSDAIDIVSGINYYNFGKYVVGYMYIPRGHNAELAGAVKKELKIPVCVAGRINDPFVAEEILKKGQADFVDLGRTLIADPYFVSKTQAGKVKDICMCIACGRCIEAILKEKKPMICSVNPAVGQERAYAAGMAPATKKKRVLVVGGGPGGMNAAIVAAERGHTVTLWEKSNKLGGILNLAIAPPHKDELKNLIEYLPHRMKQLKVDVKMGKEGTADAVAKFGADAVVVATGSLPLIPKIKGMDKKKTIQFRDVLADKVKVGKKVVVIGGGFVGCEVADLLASKGKQVTVVEILPSLANEFIVYYADVLKEELDKAGVKYFTSVKDEEITEKGVNIIDKDGKQIFLEADDVVISTGAVPDKALAEALKGEVSELYEVGDCVKACRIYEAMSDGAKAGMKI